MGRPIFASGFSRALRSFVAEQNVTRNVSLRSVTCLGGCGVLELARAGASLRGVVSLHGILNSPQPAQRKTVVSKILVLHGDADPVAPFDQLTALREEMRAAEVNWELDIYGGARHSFTGEGILDQTSPEAGLHPQSEARSWRAILEFLTEVLDTPH